MRTFLTLVVALCVAGCHLAKPNADREEACPTADSPPRTLSIGDRVTRHVPAEAPDGLTGVLVEDGAAYRLEANGTTRDASLAETTPEGYAPNSSGFGFELFRLFGQHKLRYPSAAWFELVGFVATDSQPANYFAIGRGVAEWKPERVGELVVFLNDVPGHYPNNIGCTSLTVTRLR